MMNDERSNGRPPVVLDVPVELDARCADVLRQRIVTEIERGNVDICLDLTTTRFIDSAGLGVIIGGWKRARSAGGDLTIARPTVAVRELLKVTGLDGIIAVSTIGSQSRDA